jgi:hypothetical protein
MSQESLVVQVTLGLVLPLTNSDKLEITHVHGGYPCIIQKGQFKAGDKAWYIPVDTIVPTDRPEFAFLAKAGKTEHRIKAMRLRGTFSMGLLVADTDPTALRKYLPPCEIEVPRNPGDRALKEPWWLRMLDKWGFYSLLPLVWPLACLPWYVGGFLALILGFFGSAGHRHLVRTIRNSRKVPSLQHYDIEGMRKYVKFIEGEPVVVTEKIHGMHAAFYRRGSKLYCYSRTMLRTGNNVWTQIAKQYGLHRIPDGYILRGEIFGKGVQDLEYGLPGKQFRAFDLQEFKTRQYMDSVEFFEACRRLDIPTVPVLFTGPYGEDLKMLAEGPTTFGAVHCREGIVIKPRFERTEQGLGRLILKLVGQDYLLR